MCELALVSIFAYSGLLEWSTKLSFVTAGGGRWRCRFAGSTFESSVVHQAVYQPSESTVRRNGSSAGKSGVFPIHAIGYCSSIYRTDSTIHRLHWSSLVGGRYSTIVFRCQLQVQIIKTVQRRLMHYGSRHHVKLIRHLIQGILMFVPRVIRKQIHCSTL